MGNVGSLAPPSHDHADWQAPHDPWVARFGRTVRFAHWWTVSMVAAALLTGSAMGDEAKSGPVLWTHIASVVLIFVGILAALAFGDRSALLKTARLIFTFERTDAAWVAARMRHPVHHSGEFRWGMFNAGQKFLAWALCASSAAVVATGIQSALAGGGGLHPPAVAITSALLGAHIFMAVVNPATRPALAGMVFGRVRRTWAAQHHSRWLDDLDDPDSSAR